MSGSLRSLIHSFGMGSDFKRNRSKRLQGTGCPTTASSRLFQRLRGGRWRQPSLGRTRVTPPPSKRGSWTGKATSGPSSRSATPRTVGQPAQPQGWVCPTALLEQRKQDRAADGGLSRSDVHRPSRPSSRGSAVPTPERTLWGSKSRRRRSRGVSILVDDDAEDPGAEQASVVEVVHDCGLLGRAGR